MSINENRKLILLILIMAILKAIQCLMIMSIQCNNV